VSTVKWKYSLNISGFESCRGERIFCSRNRFKDALGGPSNKWRCQDGKILKLVSHLYIFPSCKLGDVIFQYFLEDVTAFKSLKMYLQKVGGGRGDWMELAQDRDRWRALVGAVRDFRVP
jgi:hypothetical protein